MADRLDLLLLGASGFSGKLCILYLQRLCTSDGRNLTWGVAGRSEEKLKQTLEGAEKKIGAKLQHIPIIVADVNDEDSLQKMALRARVVLNCCGPYRFLGDAVIKACIAAGTHVVDLSSPIVEPQYVENVQVEWHEAAKEKGVYVINGCGVDSIAGDLGIACLQREFEGTLNSITVYLECGKRGRGALVSSGTWKSEVHSISFSSEFKEFGKQLLPNHRPVFKPELKLRLVPHKFKDVNGWAVLFPGTTSPSYRRSQKHFYEVDQTRPAQVYTYVVLPSFSYLVCAVFYGLLCISLAKFECGRKLLLNHPERFSYGIAGKGHIADEELDENIFHLTFYGEGWKEKLANKDDQITTPCNKCIAGRIKLEMSPYEFSGMALVLSAIVIATEVSKMPGKGGVFPPGAAFAKTSFYKQFRENGIVCDVLYQKDL